VTLEELLWMASAGLATGLGGIALLAARSPTELVLDGLLGFTAGVMLAATSFSLLVPGLERGSAWEVLVGFALGAITLALLDRFVPHAHARLAERGHVPVGKVAEHQRAALLLSALTIHNIPEGMAVGLAFAAGGTELGLPIALAIGIQNIPEGFAAGAPLLQAGVRPKAAATVGFLTGIVEPPAAFAAFYAFEFADTLLAGGLGFAAGAMLYVVCDELIPESHGRGHEQIATAALLLGFALMLGLDTSLG
jgi:ZIP family zinc transporter